MDPEMFRRLLRRHAASVVVVTAPGDPPAGLTATSFTSVSLHPPLVSFCVARSASRWPTIEAASTVAVHVLSEHQEPLARVFAARGVDGFGACGAWRLGPDRVPLLDGVLAWLVCTVADRVPAGDHTIILASPHTGSGSTLLDAGPLLYHAGRYLSLDRSP
jgi:flavin reductase (DIM6/NTAB) family NADH-FMN oxidoreductase RutF